MWSYAFVPSPPKGAVVALVCCLLALAFVSPARADHFEAGSFTAHATNVDPTPNTVSFQQTFDVPPIVVVLNDNNGSDPAITRITNITTTGFDELTLEPSPDGPHATMTVHYIAIEPGRYVLPGGQIVEAGRDDISNVQHGNGVTGPRSWGTANFSAALPNTPSVIAQIQTANSETAAVASVPSLPYISATIRNLTTSNFELALERSEANGGPIPSAETIGWIAFPAGFSGSFPDVSSTSITWSAVNTADNISGWDNGCFTNGFGQTSASAIVVATKNRRDGGDGGWLRRCSISSTLIGLTVDEDTVRDSERSHTTESASIIAFSQAFHAELNADLSVTKASVSNVSPSGGGFNTPEATVEYLITVSNLGDAPPNYGSVIAIDSLPPELAFVMTDFSGPGSGPVQFSDGTPATGLGCTFISLASTADCFDFSTDGTDFTHTPSDSGDGTDPAITHIRIRPTGFMEADTGAGPTSFDVRFRAVIK
jgi:uncharacterized repeat protein (TIGR01451 family)